MIENAQTQESGMEYYFDLMGVEEMIQHSFELLITHIEHQHFSDDLSKKAQFISYLTDYLRSLSKKDTQMADKSAEAIGVGGEVNHG